MNEEGQGQGQDRADQICGRLPMVSLIDQRSFSRLRILGRTEDSTCWLVVSDMLTPCDVEVRQLGRQRTFDLGLVTCHIYGFLGILGVLVSSMVGT